MMEGGGISSESTSQTGGGTAPQSQESARHHTQEEEPHLIEEGGAPEYDVNNQILYDRDEYQRAMAVVGEEGAVKAFEEAPDFFDLENMDMVARKTIKEMRKTNALIQFPQDEYQAPATLENRGSGGKLSEEHKKRASLIFEEDSFEESKTELLKR